MMTTFQLYWQRHRLVTLVLTSFLAGLYMGRVSVLHTWWERVALLLWLTNAAAQWWSLSREFRRERDAFRREMFRLEEDYRRRVQE